MPVKQRHTAKRIFERLRDEHGSGGGYTVVKDHVRVCRARGRETFVPLAHPPGHAQVDFIEAIAIGAIGGVRQKVHFLCMDLPQSGTCFVKADPRATTKAFLDRHVAAFATTSAQGRGSRGGGAADRTADDIFRSQARLPDGSVGQVDLRYHVHPRTSVMDRVGELTSSLARPTARDAVNKPPPVSDRLFENASSFPPKESTTRPAGKARSSKRC